MSMAARLAYFCHIDPLTFGQMDPAFTQELDRRVWELHKGEIDLRVMLADRARTPI